MSNVRRKRRARAGDDAIRNLGLLRRQAIPRNPDVPMWHERATCTTDAVTYCWERLLPEHRRNNHELRYIKDRSSPGKMPRNSRSLVTVPFTFLGQR